MPIAANMLLTEAKLVINRARADLGKDLRGYSVRDLLLDNIPARSSIIDEVIALLKAEQFL